MTAEFKALPQERETRFALLVSELRDVLRRMDPHLSEAAVLEEAVHHAARRLSGGDLVSSFVG